jgi:hypothetical protein
MCNSLRFCVIEFRFTSRRLARTTSGLIGRIKRLLQYPFGVVDPESYERGRKAQKEGLEEVKRFALASKAAQGSLPRDRHVERQ